MGEGPLIANDRNYAAGRRGIPRVSGRINDFARDGRRDRTYAAVSYGGVWASDGLGGSWRSIGDGLPTQVVGAVGYSPAKGGIVLALTGDQNGGLISTAGLGLFRTLDEGRTWHKARGLPDGALGFKVEVDPTNPEVIFAATGFGLYRSTDAGATFTNVELPTGECQGESYARPGCFLANVVTDVVVQAPDGFGHAGGKILAAVGWRGGSLPHPDGKPQSPANGLYASDSGEPGSFRKLTAPGFAPQNRIGRIELGPAVGPKQDHGYVYAEVQDAQLMRGGVPGIDVPGQVRGQNPYRPTSFNGIYVSKDFGSTWTQMMTTEDVAKPGTGSSLAPIGAVPVVQYLPGIQSWYNQWIAPDPTLQTAKGVPTRLSFGLEEVWQNLATGKPLDGPADFHVIGRYYGGDSCQSVVNAPACPTEEPAPTTTHPDQHDGLWVPDGEGGVTLLVGNDGGAFVQHVEAGEQMDNTKWGDGANEGFHTLLPYDAAVSSDGTIVAGLQDNGEMKIGPDGVQTMIHDGDGFFSEIDSADSQIIYEEHPYGAIQVTKDGGRSWRSMSTNQGSTAQFSAPFVMDPLNSTHLVAGGSAVLETTGGPETSTASKVDADYSAARPQWQTVYELGAGQGGVPNSISALDTRGDGTYVGFCGRCEVLDGGTFASGIATNVGGDKPGKAGSADGWHSPEAKGLPARLITDLAVDPDDPEVVYVVLGGYKRKWIPPGALGDDPGNIGNGHVFKSSDAGATFTDISGDLPDAPAESVLVHGDQLVVSTAVGVFTSASKNGLRWVPLGEGLPYATVVSMKLSPRDPDLLVAAVFGRGVYLYEFADAARDGAPTCAGQGRPAARLTGSFTIGRRLVVRGTARVRRCQSVGSVEVAIARRAGNACRFIRSDGRPGRSVSCRHARYLRARGTRRWRLAVRRPPSGHYVVWVRATGPTGKRGPVERSALRVR